jgi:hypothetical protein
VKICKECAHFGQGSPVDPSAPYCLAPDSPPVRDPIYGHWRYKSARLMRGDAAMCGPDAKWFAPQPAFVLLPAEPPRKSWFARIWS